MNNDTQGQGYQQPPGPPPPFSHNSARAALCAIIPGIGAVYNREYIKAVIHFSIFAGLVIIAESVGVFGAAAFSFYVFTIIDAYRSAETISQRGFLDQSSSSDEQLNLPLWGGILLLMGILFLLDNLGAIRLRSAFQFWPLILIALGGYLIYTYMRPGQSILPQPRVQDAPPQEVVVPPEPSPTRSTQAGPRPIASTWCSSTTGKTCTKRIYS